MDATCLVLYYPNFLKYHMWLPKDQMHNFLISIRFHCLMSLGDTASLSIAMQMTLSFMWLGPVYFRHQNMYVTEFLAAHLGEN